MILNRIALDSDLSEASLEHTLKLLYGQKKHIVVSTGAMSLGVKLAKQFNCILHIDSNLEIDQWYIYDEYTGIFSPGA